MEDLQLDTLPAASSTAKNMRSGRLVRGEDTFDLWALGTLTGHEDDDSALAAAGGEMNGLSCLLPRKSKAGKLYAGESCLISIMPRNCPHPRSQRRRHQLVDSSYPCNLCDLWPQTPNMVLSLPRVSTRTHRDHHMPSNPSSTNLFLTATQGTTS